MENWNCAACSREDDACDMVQCERCEKWWHFDCAGVTAAVNEERWICSVCEGREKGAAASGVAEGSSRDRVSKTRSEAVCRRGAYNPGAGKLDGDKLKTRKMIPVMKTAEEEGSEASLNSNAHKEQRKPSARASLRSEGTRVSKERMQREYELQKSVLEAEMKIAKLKLEHETMRNQLEELKSNASTRSNRVTETSKVLGWVGEQRKSSVAAPPSLLSTARWRLPTAPKESSTPKWTPLDDGQIAARKVWPKKLPSFSGSPKEWPIFFHCFNESTKACGFSSVENIMRLEEALKGPARDAVASKLMLPNAAPMVMEVLQRLYGRPGQILKEMIDKVRRIQAPKPEQLEGLITFGLAVQQLCDHMIACAMEDHMTNPVLMDELIEKLPATRRLEWARFKRNFERPTLKEFGAFMDELLRDCCEVTVYAPAQGEAGRAPGCHTQRHHTFAHSSSAVEQTPVQPMQHHSNERACFLCSNIGHRAKDCWSFKRMTVADRWQAVDRLKLCRTCLGKHGMKPCKSNLSCREAGCTDRHHTLLHPTPESASVVQAQCHAHGSAVKEILFRIVPVTLHNGSRCVDTYAFLDEGSSLTLVEAALAEQLELSGVSEPLEICWTGDVKRTEKLSQRVRLEISARGEHQRYTVATAHTIQRLSLPTQTLNQDLLINEFDYFQDLSATPYQEAVPRILIGLEDVSLLKPLETRAGKEGGPIAVRSALGWAVYGPRKVDNAAPITTTNMHHRAASTEPPASISDQSEGWIASRESSKQVPELRAESGNEDERRVESDRKLQETLRQYFTLEGVGVATFSENIPEARDIARARDLLERTTVKHVNRFTTGLLWREDAICLPDSFQMALSRMKALERKLARNPDLKREVHKQIRMYVENGYAHKATQEELKTADPKRVWYLPVNIVSHPRKPEKKRLVWDAAAAVNGISLNTQLLKGPDLLVQLPGVLCKFRQRQVAFGGDIEKMFHQIRIKQEDTHSQRFLFRFDESMPPEIYLMDVATFGASCSPCSSQYVMHLNADQCAHQYPEAAAAIKTRTYMDDYYDSCDTVEEAAARVQQVKYIHAQAGFNMRNWVTNTRGVLEGMPGPSEELKRSIDIDQSDQFPRVLGMEWDPASDVIRFSTSWQDDLRPYVSGEERPTKRIALRVIMSLFDPLGLLASLLIHGRILMQDMWRVGMSWETEVDDMHYRKWHRWKSLLSELHRLSILRWYFKGVRWSS